MGRVSLFAAAGLLVATTGGAPTSRVAIPQFPKRQSETTSEVTFEDITPSKSIKWVECYQSNAPNLQCTYLTVPLDYENPEAGTADIAFARYFISEEAGDMLFNPGGPGGSGVDHIIGVPHDLAKIWNMNIVSFDPRGVGLSGPYVDCSYESSNHTTLKKRQEEVSVTSLKSIWDSNFENNHACSKANQDSNAKYVGSSAVVQDMMHFVELQATLRDQDPKTAKITFNGVSYGTLIGQTLVKLYPDRLHRVLLDANVYGVAHYQGWEPSGIDDLGHGVSMFSELCFQAGPEWCLLAEGTNSTEEVQERIDEAIRKLNKNPVNHNGNRYNGYDLENHLLDWMYTPRNDYPSIVNATLAIEDDKMETFLSARSHQKRSEDKPSNSESILSIITAVDIAGRFPFKRYDEWKAATLKLVLTSPYGALNYARGSGLIGLAMDEFVPPPSQLVSDFEFINTSVPVLFVNTAGDPVTPRSSAVNMQRLFSGSAVLIQNSPGHGYSNAPSKCTEDIIAAYIANGTVPGESMWCETNVEANYYFGGPYTQEGTE